MDARRAERIKRVVAEIEKNFNWTYETAQQCAEIATVEDIVTILFGQDPDEKRRLGPWLRARERVRKGLRSLSRNCSEHLRHSDMPIARILWLKKCADQGMRLCQIAGCCRGVEACGAEPLPE